MSAKVKMKSLNPQFHQLNPQHEMWYLVSRGKSVEYLNFRVTREGIRYHEIYIIHFLDDSNKAVGQARKRSSTPSFMRGATMQGTTRIPATSQPPLSLTNEDNLFVLAS